MVTQTQIEAKRREREIARHTWSILLFNEQRFTHTEGTQGVRQTIFSSQQKLWHKHLGWGRKRERERCQDLEDKILRYRAIQRRFCCVVDRWIAVCTEPLVALKIYLFNRIGQNGREGERDGNWLLSFLTSFWRLVGCSGWNIYQPIGVSWPGPVFLSFSHSHSLTLIHSLTSSATVSSLSPLAVQTVLNRSNLVAVVCRLLSVLWTLNSFPMFGSWSLSLSLSRLFGVSKASSVLSIDCQSQERALPE